MACGTATCSCAHGWYQGGPPAAPAAVALADIFLWTSGERSYRVLTADLEGNRVGCAGHPGGWGGVTGCASAHRCVRRTPTPHRQLMPAGTAASGPCQPRLTLNSHASAGGSPWWDCLQGSSALADMLGACPEVFVPGFEPLDVPGLTQAQKLAFMEATWTFPGVRGWRGVGGGGGALYRPHPRHSTIGAGG